MIMLSLGNMQKSSIGGSGHCIILKSFIKLWLGTLQGAAGLFILSPYTTRRCFNQSRSQGDAKFTQFES